MDMDMCGGAVTHTLPVAVYAGEQVTYVTKNLGVTGTIEDRGWRNELGPILHPTSISRKHFWYSRNFYATTKLFAKTSA
jgi:hypothetical protein